VSAAGREFGAVRPTEVAEMLQRGESFRFIDVREPLEHRVARVDGAELIPLARLPQWVGEIDPAERIVVMCHHGIRSASACAFLARNGFANVSNLTGGIDLWSLEVDPSVPRY
jgi:rhodanese-related sulfurtransferase